MDKVKIILENGIEKEVPCIFYLYNNKYYFIYTEGEMDEKGYVILYLVQVGKETQSTSTGNVDTGYMVGIEVIDPNEWNIIQKSISKIVDDKKNSTQSSEIQYLPVSMLSKLKIISKKTFRLLRTIIEEDFKLDLNEFSLNKNNFNDKTNNLQVPISDVSKNTTVEDSTVITQRPDLQNDNFYGQNNESIQVSNTTVAPKIEDDVIIDYKARFFEEQEKNEQLQEQINELIKKLENIKNIIE